MKNLLFVTGNLPENKEKREKVSEILLNLMNLWIRKTNLLEKMPKKTKFHNFLHENRPKKIFWQIPKILKFSSCHFHTTDIHHLIVTWHSS